MAKSSPSVFVALGSRWGKPVEEVDKKDSSSAYSPPIEEKENGVANNKNDDDDVTPAKKTTTTEEDANDNNNNTKTTTTASSEKKRGKRKSRWETANEEEEKATRGEATANEATPNDTNYVAVKRNAPLPGTIVISGGLRVQIPAALLGVRSMPKNAREDPELEVMFKDLETCNRNCLIGAPFSEKEFLDKRDVLKTKNSKHFPKEVEENMTKPKDDAPPVYDLHGHRVSSKSEVNRDKYEEKRGRLIEEIARRCPQFTPPADYLPSRKRRKIYIPVEEHPGYNFFGLIIGPRGNTQKKMQMETNTKIVVRGRGAAKEGSGKQDVSVDEPLHVLVEGDTMVDIDRACEMIEKLLVPVDENMNEHKREQLRQLAIMNGTLREVDEQELRLQQEEENALLYQLPDHIKSKTDEMYRKDIERVHGTGNGLEDKYSDFLSEIGVDPSSLGGKAGVSYAVGGVDQYNPLNAKISGLGAGARAAPASSVGVGAGAPQAGAAPFSGGGNNPDDKNKLYVANLPPHVTNEQLRPIFEKFGRVTACDVVPDRDKQLSCKGFAFVTFATEVEARSAIPHTNGMTIEGRVVETRIKNEPKVPIHNASGGDTAQEDVNEEAKLYVANLPSHYEEEDLKTLFSPYGLVQSVKLVLDHTTGLSKGYGFVQMMDQEQAMSAVVAVHGNMVEGCTKPLVVNIANDKKRGVLGNGYGAPMMPMMDAATAAYYYQQQQMAMYGYQQYEQQYVVPEGIQVGDMNSAPAPPPPPEIPVPPPPEIPVPPPPDQSVVVDDLPPPPPLPPSSS